MNWQLDWLQTLPETLHYQGEFGAELLLFLPFCAWLDKVGLLSNHHIITYRGMSSFYSDLKYRSYEEINLPRDYVKPELRPNWLPIKNEFDFGDIGRSPFHFVPDLRRKFSASSLSSVFPVEKPLLVIHNKYNMEWEGGPVNFISIGALDVLFRILKKDFCVIYIRHGIKPLKPCYSHDHNTSFNFQDLKVLSQHPEVLNFDTIYDDYLQKGGTQDINQFKNILYSHCYRFITTQGGGAHHIALFSGSVISILHRVGPEEFGAYGPGFYGFMAPVPPIRAICRNEDELLRSTILFGDSFVSDDRVQLGRASEKILNQLSPWTIKQRLR